MVKKVKEILPVLGILGILGIIFLANSRPRTFLIGWDNLVPELNFWTNIKRSIFSVWQEHQGLGLVGGMGHAADLLRQLILLPLSLITPISLIRYSWHFAMIGLGTLGVYFSLGKLGKRKFGKSERLLSALFYLLNFGTIQNFWVPFEPFSTFWGFFPWLITSFITLLKQPSRKNWSLFILLNLLATPSFYVPTIFVVYLLCLVFISIFHYRKKVLNFNFSILNGKIFLIILLINAFWLLPFGYFLITNSYQPRNAFGNLMATEETVDRNQFHGTIGDFLFLKGYYSDFPSGNGILMAVWKNHFAKPVILVVGYILASVCLTGLFSAPGWLIGLFLLSAIALLSATPPFSFIHTLLRQFSFLNQVFRSPFTKFIIPASFSFSLLFAHGLKLLTQKAKKPIFRFPILLITCCLLIIYSLPVFSGNLIWSRMRMEIPKEYLELISFFKNQPKNARIANLPQGSFWGWTNYRWGYLGSGFLWYGIEQPILDRAFDVWNLNNEQYYWELNYALANDDLNLLENVLLKYSVGFVIFDDNIVFPDDEISLRLKLKTKSLLDTSSLLTKAADFGNASVYRVNQTILPSLTDSELPTVYQQGFEHQDKAYQQTKGYISNGANPELIYPFTDLFGNRLPEELPFTVKEDSQSWTIEKEIPEGFVSQDSQELTVLKRLDFEKIPNLKKTVLNLTPDQFVSPHNCAPGKNDSLVEFSLSPENEFIFKAKNASLCLDWKDLQFFKKILRPVGVKIEFEYLSSSDEWPQFCFWNAISGECLNQKYSPNRGLSNQWQVYQEQLLFNPLETTIDKLALALDAYYEKGLKEIRYRNIKLTVFSLPEALLPNIAASQINYQIEVKEGKVSLTISKVDSPYFTENLIEKNLVKTTPRKCNFSLGGSYYLERKTEEGKSFLRFGSNHDDSCFSWFLPDLPLNLGWLIEIEHRHLSGQPLMVSALGSQDQLRLLHTKLGKNSDWQKSYLVIPSYQKEKEDVVLTVSNLSFNLLKTENDVASIKFIPLNWNYLSSFRLGKEANNVSPTKIPDSKGQLWQYQLTIPAAESPTTIILPQSFDPGWLAFYFDGLKPVFLRDHFKINGWANAWSLDQISNYDLPITIYLIFWPQVLEFIGFFLLPIPFIFILKRPKEK